MGIFYDPTKPASGDRPTNDQAPMQMNFSSINTLISIDHVNFMSGSYGTHKQVTFSSNNVPTPTVSLPILFTNSQDGAGNNLPVSELFLYSGTAAQSKNQYNITSTNGSVLLMMGIILKWGSQTFSGTQNPSVSFTQPFPNACFQVQLSLVNGNAASFTPANVLTSTPTTTGFSARVQASGSSTWYWFAIGN